MNLEIVNETDYELLKNDIFIINELCRLRKSGLFKSMVFKLNEKVHVDFLDFRKEYINICKNYIDIK